MMNDNDKRVSGWRRAWRALWSPAAKWSVGALLILGIIVGVLLWGAFHTAMDATNTLAFCANTCHEMHDNVYQEYISTVHYANRTGVRAVCADCHVPREWGPKVIRKIKASGELWGKLTGEIDTKEKFEKHRMVLAQNEWRQMKATDSRECRNCHSFTAMEKAKQRPRAQQRHAEAQQKGMTCIDCHKGIAHLLPDDYDENVDYTAGVKMTPIAQPVGEPGPPAASAGGPGTTKP